MTTFSPFLHGIPPISASRTGTQNLEGVNSGAKASNVPLSLTLFSSTVISLLPLSLDLIREFPVLRPQLSAAAFCSSKRNRRCDQRRRHLKPVAGGRASFAFVSVLPGFKMKRSKFGLSARKVFCWGDFLIRQFSSPVSSFSRFER